MKNNTSIPDKEQLVYLYSLGYSMSCIANILKMSAGKIHKYFHLYNIETRPIINDFSKAKISESQKGNKYAFGKKHSEETKEKISIAKSNGIGKKTINSKGYIRVYFPDHPKADKRGYILEHDLIMECAIGRWLKPDEVVHHKNEIKTDNRLKNLELMTKKEHSKLHILKRNNERKGKVMTY